MASPHASPRGLLKLGLGVLACLGGGAFAVTLMACYGTGIPPGGPPDMAPTVDLTPGGPPDLAPGCPGDGGVPDGGVPDAGCGH